MPANFFIKVILALARNLPSSIIKRSTDSSQVLSFNCRISSLRMPRRMRQSRLRCRRDEVCLGNHPWIDLSFLIWLDLIATQIDYRESENFDNCHHIINPHVLIEGMGTRSSRSIPYGGDTAIRANSRCQI